MVDLSPDASGRTRARLLDLVPGRSGAAYADWLKARNEQFDRILNTVSAGLDYNAYLDLLAVGGTLVILGAPTEPVHIDALKLITHRRSIAGSANGGIAVTQEMLDFCAAHNILPETELIDASEINDAYERVLNSQVRYRFVIDAATLTGA